MSDLQSRPYHPDPAQCCEACAFGRGDHAEWCEADSQVARRLHEDDVTGCLVQGGYERLFLDCLDQGGYGVWPVLGADVCPLCYSATLS